MMTTTATRAALNNPAPPRSATADAEPADRIATAVRSVDGVSDLHAGALGEVATYLPGRRVAGVRVRGDDAEVHVVAEWGQSVLEVGQRVRAAVEALVAGSVSVTIEDVADPPT